jgi:hypothetical protein
LILIKSRGDRRCETMASSTGSLSTMSTTFVIAAVLGIFGVFTVALAYAQFQTRGMVAPGARKLD